MSARKEPQPEQRRESCNAMEQRTRQTKQGASPHNAHIAPIILASGSPRRLEILRTHGIEPVVVLPTIDEDALTALLSDALAPQQLAKELSLCKARSVLEKEKALTSPSRTQASLILAADTLVYHEDCGMLGKPKDRDEAVSMLQRLCNTSHQVITGVTLITISTEEETTFSDVTTVHFGSYSLRDIEHYIATEPPLDKAGSYAIQGMWGRHVTALDGDLENVIGLPYYRLEKLLRE